ncbi:MAG TPA: Type 1 glutamine amidotransferase-like domain-containing protein [Bacilli bacterium]|nr:Type 1 glutamine amidotransferase-like domain-containing protein [Bacilli bacterium]
MGKIYVFGGGEISQKETYLLDKLVVSKLNKQHPKVLFIPTASHDAEGYVASFTRIYESLGCIVDSLLLVKENITDDVIKEKILNADLIYVGGGNTLFMMDTWRRYKVDELLIKAYHHGVVLSGLSAGGICWFDYGYSDSLIIEGGYEYTYVEGLHLIHMDHNPHAEEEERQGFLNSFKKRKKKALSMDNLTLAYFENGYLKTGYKCNEKAKAILVQSSGEEVTCEEVFLEFILE